MVFVLTFGHLIESTLSWSLISFLYQVITQSLKPSYFWQWYIRGLRSFPISVFSDAYITRSIIVIIRGITSWCSSSQWSLTRGIVVVVMIIFIIIVLLLSIFLLMSLSVTSILSVWESQGFMTPLSFPPFSFSFTLTELFEYVPIFIHYSRRFVLQLSFHFTWTLIWCWHHWVVTWLIFSILLIFILYIVIKSPRPSIAMLLWYSSIPPIILVLVCIASSHHIFSAALR